MLRKQIQRITLNTSKAKEISQILIFYLSDENMSCTFEQMPKYATVDNDLWLPNFKFFYDNCDIRYGNYFLIQCVDKCTSIARIYTLFDKMNPSPEYLCFYHSSLEDNNGIDNTPVLFVMHRTGHNTNI